MTLIIGVESPSENCAYLLADSGAWMNGIREVGVTPKIWRSGAWIAGGSGSLSHVIIARKRPLPDPAETVAETEILLSDWMRAVYAEAAELERNYEAIAGKQNSNPPSVICATGSHVFTIQSCDASRSMREYDAIGMNRPYALGALRALRSTSWGLDLGKRTMQCVYTDSDYVWGPVNVLSTASPVCFMMFDPSTPAMLEQLSR